MHPADWEVVFDGQIHDGHGAMMLSAKVVNLPPAPELTVQTIEPERDARALPSDHAKRFATSHIDLPKVRQASHWREVESAYQLQC